MTLLVCLPAFVIAASAEEVRLEDMGIIDSEEAAVGCALKILEQSSRILSSTSGWSTLNKPKCVGVKLESKAATGKGCAFGASPRKLTKFFLAINVFWVRPAGHGD